MAAVRENIPLQSSNSREADDVVRALQSALRTTILRAENAEEQARKAKAKFDDFVCDLQAWRERPLVLQEQEQEQGEKGEGAQAQEQEKQAQGQVQQQQQH